MVDINGLNKWPKQMASPNGLKEPYIYLFHIPAFFFFKQLRHCLDQTINQHSPSQNRLDRKSELIGTSDFCAPYKSTHNGTTGMILHTRKLFFINVQILVHRVIRYDPSYTKFFFV